MEATRTFDQAYRILEFVREKDPSREQLQKVLNSGILGDVLDANLAEFTPERRNVIRHLLGLKPVVVEAVPRPNILSIDRSKLFNPAMFIGAGWSIWRGPVNGNGLEGEEERDHRAATLTEVDLNKVQLVTCLKRGESVMTGEERIRRLKTDGRVRHDENVFKSFWENRVQLPDRFKKKVNGNIQFIFFDGVVLRGPNGYRYTLYLY
ncbi:MAG: hypothetical protein HYX22_02845, partial [Candidatus Yanofskybacteria bacterium]|nr:hypothetical protein [Candidatus Yanofskybacteria bacterium]